MTEENRKDTITTSIEGKITCNGFTIRTLEPIDRTAFLATEHMDKRYVMGVEKIWREKSNLFAEVRVLGDIPLIPFEPSSEIKFASEDEIKNALGLSIDPEKELVLGKILGTNITASFNAEK
ncbi:MAG: hypothetical protein ACTSWY_03210, partial [Promethearchaeota archaeon]